MAGEIQAQVDAMHDALQDDAACSLCGARSDWLFLWDDKRSTEWKRACRSCVERAVRHFASKERYHAKKAAGLSGKG